MIAKAEKKTNAATTSFIVGPCPAFRQAPAHVTGSPRRAQKLSSASVNRAHGFGRAQMNPRQIALAGQQTTPTQNESQ
jgi:hypothetical protein